MRHTVADVTANGGIQVIRLKRQTGTDCPHQGQATVGFNMAGRESMTTTTSAMDNDVQILCDG